MLSMHSFDDRPSSLTALWDDGIEKTTFTRVEVVF